MPGPMNTLRCQLCQKEALPEGRTCLVCGIPGERPLTLHHEGVPGEDFDGALCGPCFDEFAERRVIRGWSIRIAC